MPEPIHAPGASARSGQIQQHEAVDDSELTAVEDGKETPLRVRVEVGYRREALFIGPTGKPRYLAVPCSKRSSPNMMRSTLSSCEASGRRKSIVASLV